MTSTYEDLKAKKSEILKRIIIRFCFAFGVFSFLFLILCFTPLPYYLYHNPANYPIKKYLPVQGILVPGGNGMPTADGLFRCYKAAEALQQYKTAKCYILHVSELNDTTSEIFLMKKEMEKLGISSNRIILLARGKTTYEQMKQFAELKTDTANNLMVITKPVHFYRCRKVLQKMGYSNVFSYYVHENNTPEELITKKSKNISDNPALRYNLWSYAIYLIEVMREYFAIGYYYLTGRI